VCVRERKSKKRERIKTVRYGTKDSRCRFVHDRLYLVSKDEAFLRVAKVYPASVHDRSAIINITIIINILIIIMTIITLRIITINITL